jgi:hypothetical protein
MSLFLQAPRAPPLPDKLAVEPADFLLEVGTEELPPDEVTSAVAQLQRLFADLLSSCRLLHSGIKAFGTPRRLAVVVDGLAAEQETVEEERRGPPKSRAFDEAGKPTKAMTGFCRSCGADLSAVRFVPDKKARLRWFFASCVALQGFICVDRLVSSMSMKGCCTQIGRKADASTEDPASCKLVLLGDMSVLFGELVPATVPTALLI